MGEAVAETSKGTCKERELGRKQAEESKDKKWDNLQDQIEGVVRHDSLTCRTLTLE